MLVPAGEEMGTGADASASFSSVVFFFLAFFFFCSSLCTVSFAFS